MSLRSADQLDNALRMMVAASIALASLFLVDSANSTAQAPSKSVRNGIDVWIDRGLEPLAGRRVGLITNTTGRAADGRMTLEVLAASSAVELVAIFTPEHALAAQLEGDVGNAVHDATGLPVYSLYGETRRPTTAMLEGVEALVFDVQDVGTRFYTYATTLGYGMEAAAAHGLPIVVLDRPNPIGGRAVSGPVLKAPRQSFVAYAPVPVRHGMTIGELALLFNEELGIGADLTVIPASGWRRDMWFDATGLPWRNPSPNIRNLVQALLYPAVGPLEMTNLSVGRGTDAPFEWLGAPWIEPLELAATLNAAELPGVSFIPRHQTPESSRYAGLDCGGVNLLVTERESFDAGLTAATLATTLYRLYPQEWEPQPLLVLWGEAVILQQLESGLSPLEIAGSWARDLEAFLFRREPYLLYR